MNGVRKIEQSVFNGEVDQGSGTAIHTGRRRSMYLHPGSESVERLWGNDVVGILYIIGRDEWERECKPKPNKSEGEEG